MKKLTIEDLSTSSGSGFRYVNKNTGSSVRPFNARVQGSRQDGRPGSDALWIGPRRASAEEAAQDYCDYMNDGQQPAKPPRQPRKPRLVVDLRRSGHRRRPSTFRKKRKRPSGPRIPREGYVYCVGEQGLMEAVKVGFSDSPIHRIGEYQTGNHRLLEVLGVFKGTDDDERELHAEYERDNIRGEWFRPSAALLSEFDLEPEMIA